LRNKLARVLCSDNVTDAFGVKDVRVDDLPLI
jgi:hypothetical protein